MFSPIFALIFWIAGFIAGYGVRALISRKRRDIARDEWLDSRVRKLHDEAINLNGLP
jgi:hypothetical protein